MAERRGSRGRQSDGAGDKQAAADGAQLPRELMIMTAPDATLERARGRSVADAAPSEQALAEILQETGASLVPLFGLTGGRTAPRFDRADPDEVFRAPAPDLSTFYQVQAPDDQLDDLAERLRALDTVEAAYVKPPALLPELNDMAPSME